MKFTAACILAAVGTAIKLGYTTEEEDAVLSYIISTVFEYFDTNGSTHLDIDEYWHAIDLIEDGLGVDLGDDATKTAIFYKAAGADNLMTENECIDAVK